MEENGNELVELCLETSPLKETMDCLSKTGKGQIVYDRQALSPIIPAFDTSSGFFVPENVFKRRPMLLLEQNVEDVETKATNLRKIQALSNMPCNGSNVLNSLSKWQTELMLRRSPVEETTPVYNISHHMIMQLFEAREKEEPKIASNFRKKMEEFERASRQAAEEECLRMKQELEQRLVPTENGFDLEWSMRRIQEEAAMQRRIQADQIERKLRDMQSQQEREQQLLRDEQKRKELEQQMGEAVKRKEACFAHLAPIWRKFNQTLNSSISKELLISEVHRKLLTLSAMKVQLFSFELTEDDPLAVAVQCETTAKQLEELVESTLSDIEKHNTTMKKNEEARAAKREAMAAASAPKIAPAKLILPKPEEPSQPEVQEVDYVHKDDIAFYTQLQSEMKECETKSAAITTDPSLKSLRFDLQKAVMSPINEISDQSAQHLQEKLDRLRNLLLGNPVDVGTKRIRATQHPAGIIFCTNLLARKLVQQGEDQVNVNPKAAFPIAAVITELWIEFPSFGRLLLAHFYAQCPYLVPYYIPQKEGQSDEEYYRSLGYKYSSGKVEQQPAYLKRMSGVVRLYAAIMISVPRRNQPHPYGLTEAWRYLAALLNLPPRNEITAGVLEVFLSVVGNSMAEEYGKQFQKLLHLICTEYFTMIHNVTPPGSGGGPAFRLENFLHDSIKAGGIAPPAGQLPARFW